MKSKFKRAKQTPENFVHLQNEFDKAEKLFFCLHKTFRCVFQIKKKQNSASVEISLNFHLIVFDTLFKFESRSSLFVNLLFSPQAMLN